MPLFDDLILGADFAAVVQKPTKEVLRELYAEGCGAFVGREQCAKQIAGFNTGSPATRWQTFIGAWWGSEVPTVDTPYTVGLCLDHGAGRDGKIHNELLLKDIDADLLFMQMAEAAGWFISQGYRLDFTP